jgi:hypothetical protein
MLGRCGLRAEAGAQQVERLDPRTSVGVGLLLDNVPAVTDPERRGPHAQSPG